MDGPLDPPGGPFAILPDHESVDDTAQNPSGRGKYPVCRNPRALARLPPSHAVLRTGRPIPELLFRLDPGTAPFRTR
jgi:hypothetical protein